MADLPSDDSSPPVETTGAGRSFQPAKPAGDTLTLELPVVAMGQVSEETLDRTAARAQPVDGQSSKSTASGSNEASDRHSSDYYAERAYGIGGPWRLRSADALKAGQLSIRNEFNWSTGHNEGGDDISYALTLDYGIAPMHHLTLETTSIDIGDGSVTGNGDIRLGWHWQLVKEDDAIPAMAIRNYIRMPTGHESSGVDYELRGLFSKSVADHVRVHFAPFLKSVNGDNIEDVRGFQWGAAIGSDWKITDTMDLVIDYVHETAQSDGLRNQHSLDTGLIFEVAKGHKFGVNARVGLDGDGVNGDWGAGVFYTIALDDLPSLAK